MSQPTREPNDDELRQQGWTYQPYESAPAGSAVVPAAQSSSAPAPAAEVGLGGLDGTAGTHQFVLGLSSLGAGIPITAIAADQAGLPGMLIAWIGIVGINVAHGLSRRKR